jgi:hypothetical protein
VLLKYVPACFLAADILRHVLTFSVVIDVYATCSLNDCGRAGGAAAEPAAEAEPAAPAPAPARFGGHYVQQHDGQVLTWEQNAELELRQQLDSEAPSLNAIPSSRYDRIVDHLYTRDQTLSKARMKEILVEVIMAYRVSTAGGAAAEAQDPVADCADDTDEADT